MPGEQSLFGQRIGIMLGRIQHHLYDAFDIPIHRCQRADIHAQSPGYGGIHLLAIEVFTPDLARLDDIFRQRLELGF